MKILKKKNVLLPSSILCFFIGAFPSTKKIKKVINIEHFSSFYTVISRRVENEKFHMNSSLFNFHYSANITVAISIWKKMFN